MAEPKIEELKKIKEKIKGAPKVERKEELKKRYEVMEAIPEQEIPEEIPREAPKLPEREEEISGLVLRTERMEGKIDMLDGFRRDAEERIMRITGEVGELRSMFLEVEKRFSSLEATSKKALDAVERIAPERIVREFDKRDEELLKLRAELEKNAALLKILQEQSRKLTDTLEKIKDIENLLEISRKIEEKSAKIDETRVYTDKTAAKVEVIFSRLSESLAEIERYKEKTKRLEEMSADIVKMLDEVTLKLKPEELKKNFDKILEIENLARGLKEREEKLEEAVSEKALGKVFSKLIEETKKSYEKRFSEVEMWIRGVEELEEKMSTLSKSIKELQAVTDAIGELQKKSSLSEKDIALLSERIEGLEKIKSEISLLASQIRELQSVAKALPSVQKIPASIEELLKKFASYEERINSVSSELKNLRETTRKLTATAMNGFESFERNQRKLELYLNFLKELGLIPHLPNVESLKTHLETLQNLVVEMKKQDLFGEEIKKVLEDMLTGVAKKWESSGEKEVPKLLREGAYRYLVSK